MPTTQQGEFESLRHSVWRFDFLSKFFPHGFNGLPPVVICQAVAFLVSLFMVMYPFVQFAYYISRGILLVSPALPLMFLGGLIGLGMLRTAKDLEA